MSDCITTALVDVGAALASLYDQLATIRRPGLTSDGGLGQVEALSTIASDIPCLVDASGFTREERPLAGVVTASKLWSVSMPLSALTGVTVLPQDQIAVGMSVYQVQNTNDGESYQIELIATCVKLTPAL